MLLLYPEQSLPLQRTRLHQLQAEMVVLQDEAMLLAMLAIAGSARKPDAKTEGGDMDRICNQLERRVDPDEAGKRCQTDENASDGEETYECEGSESSMSSYHPLLLLWAHTPKGVGIVAKTCTAATSVAAARVLRD